jgi:hypothetical protein
MVSGDGLTLGGEIRFGVLSFVADDSAWLQEAPLDVEALPIRGATHFRVSSFGVLLRQPSTPYQSAPLRFTSRRRKRSGRSRLQRWIKHAVALQAAAPQVAAIEPDEPVFDLFTSLHEHSESLSECESSDPAAEVLMADSPPSPPGYGRSGAETGDPSHADLDGGCDRHDDEYYPRPLTRQQREEL